jgi:hypothetical protein
MLQISSQESSQSSLQSHPLNTYKPKEVYLFTTLCYIGSVFAKVYENEKDVEDFKPPVYEKSPE